MVNRDQTQKSKNLSPDNSKEAEQAESYLKERVVIVSKVHKERKIFDARCPNSFMQQGVFITVVQNLFPALLQISKEKVLKACLKLTNVFDFSGRASFQAGTRAGLHLY